MTMKRTFALTAAVALVLAAALVVSMHSGAIAEAARGGKARGGTATLAVSPNPAPVGTTEVIVSGSGFKAGEGLNVGIPGVVPSYSVVTDSNGSFSLTYQKGSGTPFAAGEYTFQAFSWKRNGWVLAATATLVVQ